MDFDSGDCLFKAKRRRFFRRDDPGSHQLDLRQQVDHLIRDSYTSKLGADFIISNFLLTSNFLAKQQQNYFFNNKTIPSLED